MGQYLEEIFSEDVQSNNRISDIFQSAIFIQNTLKDIQEELQRILVQKMNLKENNINFMPAHPEIKNNKHCSFDDKFVLLILSTSSRLE